MKREERTPTTEATTALNVAWDYWVDLAERIRASNPSCDLSKKLGLADPDGFFADKIFGETWDSPETDGDRSGDEFIELTATADTLPFALIYVMGIVVEYSVQAIKADQDGHRELAWTYAIDAAYWAGLLMGAWSTKASAPNPAEQLAKIRHTKTYALREQALNYWREHIDPSLSASKAAEEIARAEVVPLSYKKLAELIAAEKKKRP